MLNRENGKREMEKLIIEIARSKDHYGAYAVNCPGVYGAGDTVEDAKKNVLEGLKLFVESRSKDVLPDILKGDYEIIYRFDIQSILNYYAKVFSKSALERMTGINQKQLHHYDSGMKNPRLPQRKKIEKALHDLGNDLLAVEL
jgi:predicted RNase H-like HicB family nuclease